MILDDPAQLHPVHMSLEQLDSLTQSSQLSDSNTEIDDMRRRNLDRIFYLSSEARKVVGKLKGVRANLSAFSNINSSAQAIRQELEHYIANKNLGHIDNAFAQADQGLAIHLAQLPSRSASAEADSILDSFRKSSRSAIGELKANEGILKQKIAVLEQAIQDQQSKIDQAEESVRESKQDLANTIANTEVSFDSLKTSIEADFAALRQAESDILKAQMKSADNLIEYKLSQIEQKKTEAASIVQSVGDILTTGTYKATAENEAVLANRFRLVTIGLFTVGILIVVSNFIMHATAAFKGIPFEETPWMIASRFATAIAVALPALYTARESARHRTNADRARQRELELTTLGPFIELLPDDKKQQIRDRLTDRYFGGEIDKHEIPSPVDHASLTKLIEAVAKLKPA
jgi:hypothetical protein